MAWTALLLDLVPVLIFVIFDRLGKIKYAVAGAVLAALLELLVSHFILDGIHVISIVYASLFLVFGGLSYKFNNSFFFKLKPAFISLVTGLVFAITYASGKPFMVLLLERYSDSLPSQVNHLITSAHWQQIFTRVSFNLIFGLFAHAALIAWVARHHSTWWWFAASYGGGFAVVYLALQLAL